MEAKEALKEEEGQGKSRASKKAGRMRSLSVQQKSSSEQKSLEGTLKSEWSKRESTFIESAEAEGNPRDVLNSRITELEEQLKEAEDRYKQLTEEARSARELYEAEKGECEDVVFVAKRNVKRLVNKILERQERKRELAQNIEKADQDAKREERRRAQQRALEEESLTRNVVLLQTKLLILEGKRYERDRLVKKIQEAEKEVDALDKRHDEAMVKARQEMRTKYEKLHATLVPCVRAVSESVWELSRAQQFASLSERQRSIVGTQGRYRKVVQLSLQLRDKKKRLQEQRDALHREMQVEASLAKALAARAEVARQEILAAAVKIHHETVQEEKREPEVNRHAEFEALIKELENEVFHKKDLKEELGQIAADQVNYKKALDEEEKKRKMLREKLLSMAHVAEMVLGRTAMTQEPTVSSPNPSEQSEFLEKMSTILLETTKAEGEPESERDFRGERGIPYMKGLLGLVPRESPRETHEGSVRPESLLTSLGLQSGPPAEPSSQSTDTNRLERSTHRPSLEL